LLNLDLNLTLLQTLRPCWTNLLSILRGYALLVQGMQVLKFICAEIVFPHLCIERNGATHRRKPMRIAISSQVDAKTRVKIDRLQTLC